MSNKEEVEDFSLVSYPNVFLAISMFILLVFFGGKFIFDAFGKIYIAKSEEQKTGIHLIEKINSIERTSLAGAKQSFLTKDVNLFTFIKTKDIEIKSKEVVILNADLSDLFYVYPINDNQIEFDKNKLALCVDKNDDIECFINDTFKLLK